MPFLNVRWQKPENQENGPSSGKCSWISLSSLKCNLDANASRGICKDPLIQHEEDISLVVLYVCACNTCLAKRAYTTNYLFCTSLCVSATQICVSKCCLCGSDNPT